MQKVLDEIILADSSGVLSKYTKKKNYIDNIKKSLSLHSNNKQSVEAAVIAGVKLCKASTYVSTLEPTNRIFTLVQTVMVDLKVIVLNINLTS